MNIVSGDTESGLYEMHYAGVGGIVQISTQPIGRDRVAVGIVAFGLPISLKVSVETLQLLTGHLSRAISSTVMKDGNDANQNGVSG